MFLLWLNSCPDVEMGLLFQFPHPPRAGPVLLILLFSPPSSFVLPSFAWFYIFFSIGQVLLSIFSWYCAWLLCLKVYLWCTHGGRCIPHLLSPPPFCSLPAWRIFSCGMQALSCGQWELVSRPEISAFLSALGTWSLGHWTTRDVPRNQKFF